jgi:hypothetical protein
MTTTAHSASLEHCTHLLNRFSFQMRVLSWVPLPLMAGSVLAVRYFDPRWYSNAIIVAMLALFTAGQIVALLQFLSLARGGRTAEESIRTLMRMAEHPDPEAFRKTVFALPPSHVRNIVLSWIDLGHRAGETKGLQLLDNARERRDLADGKILGFHVSLNRNILKLGFLGTLIGLLLTFPPMRAAAMGLGASGGELKFINDIAAAIDEDAYAIQATLIAMGFSFLLEAIVVQILERLFLNFQMVDSHMGDWYILSLLPWLQSHAPASVAEAGPQVATARSEERAHLDFVATEHGRIAQTVRDAERDLERRRQELSDFEARYRQWLPRETSK